MIISNGVIFQLISELNLDNVTVPTSVNSLHSFIPPSYIPVLLTPTKTTWSFIRAFWSLRIHACQYIFAHGPPAPFSTSNLPVSSVTLPDALDHAKLIHVAIFCYNMKCCRHMNVPASPPPPDSHETIFLCTLQQHMYHLMCFMIKLLKVLDRAKSQLSNKTLYHQVQSCHQNFCYSFEKSFRCCWESMWKEISNNWRCRLHFITCLTLVSDWIHADYMYICHSHVSQPYSQPY